MGSAETDEIADLRASRRRLLLAADAERRAIERALHDGLQQQLVGLAADLELASGSLETDPVEAKKHLEEVRRDVAQALEEMRTLAHRIYPPLEAGGLVPALRHAAANAGVPTRIDVTLGSTLPTEIVGAVYFCCLDALGRAAGAAMTITVREEAEGLAFELTVDREVDPEQSPMRDRVEALGGSLTVRSEPGHGTVWAGSLPVSR